MGDDLSHRKSECGTHASRHDAMASVDRSPLAARQEQHSEQRDEEHLSLQREEPQRVLDAVSAARQPIEDSVGVEIDDQTLPLGPDTPAPPKARVGVDRPARADGRRR